MIKIVLFNKSNSVSLLENILRYNDVKYQITVFNKEVYLDAYLKRDLIDGDVVVFANQNDLIDVKRAIRSEFGLKNELCKFFTGCSDYYFKNSNSANNGDLSSFSTCTFPFGFNPLIKGVASFCGKIGEHNLLCLLDDRCEIEKILDLIKENFIKKTIQKTTLLKMFFVEDKEIVGLENCLDELSCNGFSWKIFDDGDGLISLYLYFEQGVSSLTISNIEKVVYSVFNDNVYADFDTTLEEVLVFMANMTHTKISTAESLTGGLIADTIVSVSGASKIFDVGLITYSNQAKMNLLGVANDTLQEFGAVSKEVAEQMAIGLRNNFACDIGVSATGIAGPTGDTPNKPIGLVYVGVCTPVKVFANKYIFKGDRAQIRRRTANVALFTLLKTIKKI